MKYILTTTIGPDIRWWPLQVTPLSKLSPFATQKGFQAIAGALKSIKRLRDGSFLVECGRKAQATDLLKTVKFVDQPVKVSVHTSLNSSLAVIWCRDLKNMSEVGILGELKDQGFGVHRVTVRKNGEVIPTSTIFLTFNSPDLPKEIKVGYLRVKVELFVHNPLRCFNCNRFGHTSAGCKTTAKYVRCAKGNKTESVMSHSCFNCSEPSCCFSHRLPRLADWERDSTLLRWETHLFPRSQTAGRGEDSSHLFTDIDIVFQCYQ